MRSSRDRGVHNLHTEQMDAVWQFWAAGLIPSALVASAARLFEAAEIGFKRCRARWQRV